MAWQLWSCSSSIRRVWIPVPLEKFTGEGWWGWGWWGRKRGKRGEQVDLVFNVFDSLQGHSAHCEEKVKKKGKEKGKDGKDGKDKTSKTNRKGKERTKEARHRHRHRMLCHLYKNPSRLRFRIERDVESPERTNWAVELELYHMFRRWNRFSIFSSFFNLESRRITLHLSQNGNTGKYPSTY
jgi:hypothetical protein